MYYRKDKIKPKTIPMLLSNNQRRMFGLPPHRKASRHKRYRTRCEASETVAAFLDYCNQE